jgi:hypothetical protein
MTQLYISAVKRNEIDKNKHGGLAIVDVGSWQVKYLTDTVWPMSYCARNSNPRGGTRGWRGLACWQGSLVAANNDSLVFFDPTLTKVRKIISHPSFSSIHGISVKDDCMYVTSTSSDTYAIVDNNHNVEVKDIFGDEQVVNLIRPWLTARGRELNKFSPTRDYREEWFEDIIHLNYVVPGQHGKVYSLFNSMNMLVQIEPTLEILWAPAPVTGSFTNDPQPTIPSLSCPHDIFEYSPGNLLINSSGLHALHAFDVSKKELKLVWSGNEDGHSWLRGIQVIGNLAYIGTTDGVLLEIDLTTGVKKRELNIFDTSTDLKQAIFSVCLSENLNKG